MYLRYFQLPDSVWEECFLDPDSNPAMKRTCYTSVYPFMLFPKKQMPVLEFAPVTIFYGGNGSGKSTLLNIIAQKLMLHRGTYFNRSSFFDDYVAGCECGLELPVPQTSKIITSDDVFDYLLEIRCVNEKIDIRREELLDEYLDQRYSGFQMKSMADYQQLKRSNDAKRLSGSKYVKANVMHNLPERSNGESAFSFFTDNICEHALYLLDEPENSLAAGLQLELQKFLEDSARFFGCQFIISTHSPFLLSMPQAVIYDLDSRPVTVKRWTELENMQSYFHFFQNRAHEFQK